ncbi:MAG TPA: isoleucine--tRNA ligase [Gemmatimonadaceae bacterium]|nr:isoleucine--tRNA ligase [Gemmatimonadaceae bacterium]
MSPETRFRLLPGDRPPDDLEREVLERWRSEGLFHRTLEAQAGGEPFVFYEGPPTANGRPGIHHVFARTVKDLICRHRAMSGRRVPRKAGWDTHGLPVEIEVEKQLGISGKQQIEEIGVEQFNRLCRESVFKYRGDWEALSERIGYWLDYEHPYVTYSNEYIESVWWALATLFDRGLLYQRHKVLPYCPRCGTPLSSHEVDQGYEDVPDPSLTVALDLSSTPDGAVERDAEGRAMRRILVWTTTPWTLVSNTALAVHPELGYVEVRRAGAADGRTLILAEARVPTLLGADHEDRWLVVRRLRGQELAGWRYRRPLDWVAFGDGEHEVIVAEEFVKADEGTGVVHMSPAFGADDYAAGQRHGLAFVQPVDARGQFPTAMPVVGGMFIKAADPLIVEELRARGTVWRAETITHRYPHCWRCRTPLFYYARESWFVRTTSFRDRMLARNRRVDWHPPEAGAGRFGDWLENNIDWAISRDRYWGTPLPVWVNDEDPSEMEAIGSYARLAERSGRRLGPDFDPHKPYIDDYTWPARSGRGTMRRVPQVIDAWFDSGSMPFAQWHFPFEQTDVFAHHYPADFIAEGVDQTRGWFYSLLAIATGLGDAIPGNEARDDTAPYRSVLVNDLVLDADGVKMSKSRGNVVDPWWVIERHGADAVRLFLVASSQVWVPRRFDEQAVRETVGRFLLTFRNVYSGIFALYANFGWTPSPADPEPARRPPVDRWMLSRLAVVERAVDADLEAMDATAAARRLMEFVVGDVSNWYVRLNRARFYDVDGDDNRAAFATLHEVLVVTSRLLAPFAPFISDWVHRELTGESVHLAPYVRAAVGGEELEPGLLQAMETIRTLATLARAAREEAGVKVRQPLTRLVCVVPRMDTSALAPLVPLLASELNVKQVDFVGSSDRLVTLQAKPNFRALGRKWGKQTPQAAEAVLALSNDALMAVERGEGVEIAVDGVRRPVEPGDVTILRSAAGELVVRESGGYVAAIDPVLTQALRQEGLVRELVSRVQRTRKELGLAVSDRIRLAIAGNADVEAAVQAYRDRIASDVLAVEIAVGDPAGDHSGMQTIDLDGIAVRIAITRTG